MRFDEGCAFKRLAAFGVGIVFCLVNYVISFGDRLGEPSGLTLGESIGVVFLMMLFGVIVTFLAVVSAERV